MAPGVPLAAGEGEHLHVGPVTLAIKASAAATAGAYCLAETVIPPRHLSPPHAHAAEDQFVYVLEGTIGFRTGEQEVLVGTGGSVLRPRGVPHALWNPTDEPARILELTSPGTVETYFRRAHELTQAGAATPEALRELAAGHGITPVPAWIDDLAARYGVSLVGGPETDGSRTIDEQSA
jgi:quercetin dioxygenase-like cupin family protein